MTEAVQTETNESTESTEPETTKVRLKELPDSILHPSPTAVKTIALGPIFIAKVEETNQLLDEFASIREAYNKSNEALDKSDHPKAVEWRQLKAATEATIKRVQTESDEAKQIQKLQEIISKKVNDARDNLKNVRASAQAEVTGNLVSEFDPETLSQRLTDQNTVLTTMKKVLSDENPELSKWSTIDPAQAQGKKSSRKSTTGTRRPRLAYVFVDDVEIQASGKYVTSTDVCKYLGITDVKSLNTLMFGAVGDPDQIPSTEFHFPVTVQGKEHQIRAAGRTTSDAEAEAA